MKPLRTPARNALPRKPFSQPVYDGWTLEDVEAYPVLPDDTVKAVSQRLSTFNEQTPEFNEHLLYKIIEAFSISAQELGITSQATLPGAQPWLTSKPMLMSKPMPLWAGANPVPPAVEMPIGFDGWTESDFIDRREMFALMETGQAWSYAQCIWLQNKAEQFEKADLDQMFPGGVHKWHFYARTHCPRYKAEQPRYIQQRDAQDNAS